MTEAELAGRKKPLKYGNKKKMVEGRLFDSTKEAKRYQELKILEHGKLIADLKMQPIIRCLVNGVHVCDYIADFFYTEKGLPVYEDVKSDYTRKLPVYRLKKRLVSALFGIEVREA